jgi:hypothetical protein
VMTCVAILLPLLFYLSYTFSSHLSVKHTSSAAIGLSGPPESGILQHVTNQTLGVSTTEPRSHAL